MDDDSSKRPRGSSAAWREGDLLVVDRRARERLPEVCVLSGERAAGRIPCVFHRQRRFLSGGGTPEAVLFGLVMHYVTDVDKALVRMPLSRGLLWRWRAGWALMAAVVLAASATIAGLWFGQQAIEAMPRGEARTFWRDLGIPLVALGGFAAVAAPALVAHKIMPTPTVRLRVIALTDDRLHLQGAHPEFLAALSERPSRAT